MSNNTSRSELISAVERQDWDQVKELLRRSDARALVECTDAGNWNALHEACQRNTPSDIIQAMVDTSTRAPLEKDWNGWTPLHWAIIRPSKNKTIILLEACPQAASIADNRGNTPLHRAIENNTSLNVIRHIIAANPAAAEATNDDGVTPLRMLFRRWNVPLRESLDSINDDKNVADDVILRYEFGEQIRIEEMYQTALFLLQAATHGSIETIQESPFQPIHSAINNPRCPWSLVNLILKLDPTEASQWNQEGKLPIHAAAASTSSFDGELYKCWDCDCSIQNASWFVNKRDWHKIYCTNCFQQRRYQARREEFDFMNSVDKIPAVIGNLLSMNEKFAGIPDHEDRLLLHIVIENEKTFKEGLKIIHQAAPDALSTRDMNTHLYPFMLHAVPYSEETKRKKGEPSVKFLQKFTSCNALLMENPELVRLGILERGSKRSQDGDA